MICILVILTGAPIVKDLNNANKSKYNKKLTKIDIVEQQLLNANELFCSGERIITTITIAGASEEILGKLVSSTGQANSIESEVRDQCDIFESFFGRVGDSKTFRDLENNARNELKHIGTGNDVALDLEQEAVNLIERGINNFKMLRPGFNSAFQAFDDKAAAWWRKRTNQFNRTAD
mgnify:CR=1 FL=1